jgi:hypothetical protein
MKTPPSPSNDDSDDQFESADEGESEPSSPSKAPVSDGWGDWNIDDELAIEKVTETIDSASSLSSSPSKTGLSRSQTVSEEEDRSFTSHASRSPKKKYRKKSVDAAHDAHCVLDRLAAQSPSRTVGRCRRSTEIEMNFSLSSRTGMHLGTISARS